MTVLPKKLNLNGLTKRWVFSVLSVVLGVLILFTGTVLVAVHQYYRMAVQNFLVTEAEDVMNLFDSYASAGSEEFAAGAKEYAESFLRHEEMEVQFLTSDGSILFSTAGFVSDKYEQSTDYSNALTSADRVAVWRGRTDAGEPVMTATSVILSSQNKSVCVGAIRVVVSLEGVNRQYRMVATVVISVVFVFFLMIMLSGFYFIRSIVLPVQGIGQRARQIAHGDFATRIEVDPRRKDEIAALCTTINQMAEELASTEQMKNEFISSVSHELRTPLTAIKGWGETVMGALDDPELTRKGMEVIIGEAERLSVIVEDLLDFSRMQNGKLTYDMKPCDVAAEMGEAIISLSATAAEQKVLLDFNEPEQVPILVGDAGRLQQVFVNIVGNALKYTPAGGSIVVDIKTHENEIEILVSDTGCGIDPEDLAYIKQKFYKGKDAVRGSGIGLAIADEIVTAHGGHIEIASTLHVGTTVTVFLPVRSEHLLDDSD